MLPPTPDPAARQTLKSFVKAMESIKAIVQSRPSLLVGRRQCPVGDLAASARWVRPLSALKR